MPALSVFLRDGDRLFHTYSTYTRGLDQFLNTYISWITRRSTAPRLHPRIAQKFAPYASQRKPKPPFPKPTLTWPQALRSLQPPGRLRLPLRGERHGY
jgi:hypothetical protein